MYGRGRPSTREFPTGSAAVQVGNATSPSGNVADRPWSGLTIVARTSNCDWCSDRPAGDSPAMVPQAANLRSALANRRLGSEPIVIRAAFGNAIRHHRRQGLAHKSHRSSDMAPGERRGHVAADQRAARAGTPFRPRANTSRPASSARWAMNENVVGIAPLGVGAKNAATERAATATAPTMAVVGVRMTMQTPLRAAGGVPLVPEAARVPGAPPPRGSPGRLPHVLLAMSVAGTPPVPPLARSVLFGERPGVRRHGPTRRTCGNESVPRLHSADTDQQPARKRH